MPHREKVTEEIANELSKPEGAANAADILSGVGLGASAGELEALKR